MNSKWKVFFAVVLAGFLTLGVVLGLGYMGQSVVASVESEPPIAAVGGVRATLFKIVMSDPPAGLSISGPEEVAVGQNATFDVFLSSGTPPITYTWWGTDLPLIMTDTHALNHTFSYTWTTYGRKHIVATASNVAGMVTDTFFVDITPLPMEIHKSVSPPLAAPPGGVLEYTITYTNTMPLMATGITISNVVPLHTDFLDAQPGGHLVEDVVVWDLGSIPSGGTETVSFRVQVQKPMTLGHTIDSQSYLYSQQTGWLSSNPVETTLVLMPDFGLSEKKTASGDSTILPGDYITYEIVYTNFGNEDAFAVVIEDVLSEYLHYISGGTYHTDTHMVSFEVGGVTVEESGVVSFTAQVREDAPGGGIISNVAQVSFSRTSFHTRPVKRLILGPNLHLQKTVTPTGVLDVGSLVTYTLVYTNSGSSDATNVVISDPLPRGLRYQGGADSWDGSTLQWNLGNLASGAQGQVTFVGLVKDAVGEIRNQAHLSSVEQEISSNVVTNAVDTAALEVYKRVYPRDQVSGGSLLTYTLYYTNTGLYPVTQARILDPIPAHTSYASGGTYLLDENAVQFDIGTVNPGQHGVVSFTVQVDIQAGILITNVAQIYFDEYYPANFPTRDALDIQGTLTYGPLGGNSGRQYVAQSFEATSPRLKRAGMFLYGREVDYPNLRIHIWGNNAGYPDPSQVLASSEWLSLGATGQRYYATPVLPMRLTVGNRYWVVTEFTLGDSGNAGIRYAAGDVYPPGEWLFSGDGATWDEPPVSDTDLDILVEYAVPPLSNMVATMVLEPLKCLNVTPEVLSIWAVLDSGISSPQILEIQNCDVGIVDWTASYTASWLQLSSSQGTAPSTITVTADVAGLGLGIHTDTLVFDGGEGTMHSPFEVIVRLRVGTGKVYLPLVMRGWPPPPAPVTLNPIDNAPDYYGTYTVTWEIGEHATLYELQESPFQNFSNAPTVYRGDNLYYNVIDTGPARYFYRVRGINSLGAGPWSAVQFVDVKWESGNNNDPGSADGPLYIGQDYYGYLEDDPNNRRDWFKFYLPKSGQVTVHLENYIAAERNGWLVLFHEGWEEANRCDFKRMGGDTTRDRVSNTSTLGSCNGKPGLYYIRIDIATEPDTSAPYTLRVTTP